MLLGFEIRDYDTENFWNSFKFQGSIYIWIRVPDNDIIRAKLFFESVEDLCDIHIPKFKSSIKPHDNICLVRNNANLGKIHKLCSFYLATASIILHYPEIIKTPAEYASEYFADLIAERPFYLDLILLGTDRVNYSEREVNIFKKTSIACEYYYNRDAHFDRLIVNVHNPACLELLNVITQVPHYQVALKYTKDNV